MFITKSRHTEIIKLLELSHAQQQSLYFNQVEQLKEQIADLKKLIFIPKTEPAREIRELDSVISGSEKPVEMSEAERNAILEGVREMDLIISGNYDTELFNE
jgi:hypothetical protein